MGAGREDKEDQRYAERLKMLKKNGEQQMIQRSRELITDRSHLEEVVNDGLFYN